LIAIMRTISPRVLAAIALASGALAAACASIAPAIQASALAGTRWVAQLVDGRPVSAERAPQIAFTAEDRITGSGGCNRLRGVYEAADGRIGISALGRTEMACEPAVMRQEDAFIAVLDAATSYRQEGARLVIVAEDGRTIVLIPASG